MNTEISRHLLGNQSSHASISPETLENMGKEASVLHMTTGLSLNDAVVKVSSSYPDFNSEQAKRVAEFANTATYLAMHDKNKTAGSAYSYPQFELADPGRIIQDLSDGARPTKVTEADLDYSRLPQKNTVSSEHADKMIDELFKTSGISEHNTSKDDALSDVMALKYTLESSRDLLRNSGENFDLMNKEASELYYSSVKTHLLEGNGFSDVVLAARSTGASPEKVASVMKEIVPRLLKEKVASPNSLRMAPGALEKVAHRVVNNQHPLVQYFSDIVSSEAEIRKVAVALDDTESQISRIDSFLKETLRG